MVLGVCGALLSAGYKGVRDAQTKAVTEKADEIRVDGVRHAYEADVRLYDKKVVDYNTCVATAKVRIQTRSDIRDILFDYADGIGTAVAQVFPGVQAGADFAKIFADARKANVNLKYPALTEASQIALCVIPGPEPPIPPELR